MTFDQCHATLSTIRRRQGTPCPVVRIDYGGSVYRGRVTRADSDPERRPSAKSPFGVLVLEEPGLARAPATFLQIASIPPGGIGEPTEN